MSGVSAKLKSNQKKGKTKMYQVKVYNRQDGSEIMSSPDVATLDEAIEYQSSVGQGEGYYSIILEPKVTLDELLERMAVDA